MKKKSTIIILFILLSFVALGRSNKDTLSIIGVGDILLGTNFPSEQYLPKQQPIRLLQDVLPIFSQNDVVFGNYEGCFLDKGEVAKRCKDSTKCYVFRTPDSYVHTLKQAGFNLISNANNHVNDFGMPGQRNTVNLLEQDHIACAGLKIKPFDTIRIQGRLIGFCAFSPNKGTCSISDVKAAQATVRMLTEKCSIVIVSFHGGAEGSKYQHVPRETEIFYGENRGNVYQFAHSMIDAGADIVFGHGPHVLRAVELYKNRFIAYSLGNFCTYSRINISGVNGLAPAIQVDTDKTGRFLKARVHSFKQIKYQGVRKDPTHGAYKKIQSLTLADFPEMKNVLHFHPNGDITTF